jgi:uncharacterized phage-associated protein
MPVLSVQDVATELRSRLPDLPTKKLHKLLYYCQGHHLAAFADPLFGETITAFDMGPVVGSLWWAEKEHGVPDVGARRHLPEGALNTIGYVVSVYGALNGKQLEILTHNETPWKLADEERRRTGHRRATISVGWIADYFRNQPSDDADDELLPDEAELAAWLNGAPDRVTDNPRRDSIEDLRKEISLRV